jgi:8-hydroxy-5-deazaflavin:NADPH oxidoreductase
MLRLSILGGTGPEGRGIAMRLAMAGHAVCIGSRDESKALDIAIDISNSIGVHIIGLDNANAAKEGEVIFVTVPYDAQCAVLQSVEKDLAGKIIVNVVAPMEFTKGIGASAIDVAIGSAAEESQSLCPDSYVVSALQNVSAENLEDPDKILDEDVIVCSDHKDSKEIVMGLIRNIDTLRPVDGGALSNSKYVEQLTPLLVNINRIYKMHSGIKITGIEN